MLLPLLRLRKLSRLRSAIKTVNFTYPRGTYSLRIIQGLRVRIERLLRNLPPKETIEVVHIINAVLPRSKKWDRDTVFNFASKVPLPVRNAATTAQWLAANVCFLNKGTTPSPWQRTNPGGEFVTVRVHSIEPNIRETDRKHGYIVKYDILTGSPAGRVYREWVSAKRFMSAVRPVIGFDHPAGRASRTIKPLVYRHHTDVVGCYIVVGLAPGEELRSESFRQMQDLRTYNRKILALRFRVAGQCPDGHPDTHPCHRCPKGYGECIAAVRPKTVPLSVIQNVGQPEPQPERTVPAHE